MEKQGDGQTEARTGAAGMGAGAPGPDSMAEGSMSRNMSPSKSPSRSPSTSPPRLKLLAALDLILVAALVVAALALVPDPYEALLLSLALGSGGLIWFVGRRERDMARHARHGALRPDALAGRGVTLAEWHNGATLPAWKDRRGEGDRA
jgi:hypothetical protein